MTPEQPAPDLAALPWRTGPSGLVVYAQTSRGVKRVGEMVTPELAAEAVEAHNRCLRAAGRSALRREALGVTAREARVPG